MHDHSWHTLRIQSVKEVAPNTRKITFEVPEALKGVFAFKAGQYLTLQTTINGAPVRRAYSLCTAPYQQEWSVIVKTVKGGLMSGYLNTRLQPGDELEVMVPQGKFTIPLALEYARSFYLVAAGSGITPILSLLREIVETEPRSTVFLLFGNREESDIIERETLDQLAAKYEDQLHITYILSQPKKEKSSGLSGWLGKKHSNWAGKTGRIDAREVKRWYDENPPRHAETQVMVCGPGSMDEVVLQAFMECGVPGKHMHKEHFGGQELPVNAPVAGASTECATQIQLHGKSHTISVKKGQTVLEAMLAAKIDAPYSCMSGACSTCMAKLLTGEVSMDVSHGLDQEEIDQGYILTCQSRTLSSEAHIDFDA